MRPIKLVIADDDGVFRSALIDVLAMDQRFCLAGVAETAEGIVGVVSATHPDVVLVDTRLAAGAPFLADTVRWLTARRGGSAEAGPVVIALAARASRPAIEAMLRAGARGFLLKGRLGAEVGDLILRCLAGEVLLEVPEADAIRETCQVTRGSSSDSRQAG